jgi:histone acetyltransferase (RNA polymerase elongator complex component)
LKRFAPSLGPDGLRLMIVVSSERREQLFRRQLNHTRLQRLLEDQGVYLPLRDMVTIYRVQRAVPVVRPVITNRQQLRELRALRLVSRGLSDAQQQTRHVIHNNGTHTNTDISGEEGGV